MFRCAGYNTSVVNIGPRGVVGLTRPISTNTCRLILVRLSIHHRTHFQVFNLNHCWNKVGSNRFENEIEIDLKWDSLSPPGSELMVVENTKTVVSHSEFTIIYPSCGSNLLAITNRGSCKC